MYGILYSFYHLIIILLSTYEYLTLQVGGVMIVVCASINFCLIIIIIDLQKNINLTEANLETAQAELDRLQTYKATTMRGLN